MNPVTEEIRKVVRVKLAERNWSQAELAKRADLSPQFLSQIMTGKTGDLPDYWNSVLDVLGLELTAIEKAKK